MTCIARFMARVTRNAGVCRRNKTRAVRPWRGGLKSSARYLYRHCLAKSPNSPVIQSRFNLNGSFRTGGETNNASLLPSPVAFFGSAFFGDGSIFGQDNGLGRTKRTRHMASNQLPSKQGRLFALAEDMADGALAHTPAIDIKQNTEGVIRTALGIARATEITFGAAGVAKKSGTATRKTADNAGKVLIENAQKRFSKFYGGVFNAEWGAAGWPNGSLAMPS